MERFKLTGAAEWTVECNPATVSLDKARLLRAHGVNRISMGVQSLNENLLDRLGRIHSRDMVFKSFDTLRAAGFRQHKSRPDVRHSRPDVGNLARNPGRSHRARQRNILSSYEVIYEEDTPLYQQLKAGEFDVDEDLACDMYDELLSRTAGAGFINMKSPISPCTFPNARQQAQRRPSFPRAPACITSTTGAGGSFYGLGPSATGYVRGVRTKNWSNTQLYCEQWNKAGAPSNRGRNSRRAPAPAKPPRSVCA